MAARFSEISGNYPVVLCDVWGVIHNGVKAFDGAVDAMIRHRQNGGTVILITNAPRPAFGVENLLTKLSITFDCFDGIITSGDVMQQLLSARDGAALYKIGPERDNSIIEGLSFDLVSADKADLILCTGLFDDTKETAEDYRAQLKPLANRGVPLLCANPDLVVDRGGVLIPCAGAIAALYEEIGGKTIYSGKPHGPIYDSALKMAEQYRGTSVEANQTIAIGDSLRTDMKGASDKGFATVFIKNGIHHLDGTDVEGSLETMGVKPILIQDVLAW